MLDIVTFSHFLYFHEQAEANLDVSVPEFRGTTHTLDDVSDTSSLPDPELRVARQLDDVSETSSLPDPEF